MFTVQTVHSTDDEGHPINVRFTNETPSVQEITSHDLGNHGDLEQDEGHTLEHIEGHCPQSLGQTDVTSVQGSYVSLLADIATIEQHDDYQGQQIAHDIADTVDYATSTFTGQEHMQELASLQSENLVSYQSIENPNIGYSLANPVGSGQGIQQYVIIQPFLGDTSVNSSGNLIHLPNTTESHLSLESNKELEDAVANITDEVVADTDETLSSKVPPEQSYIVSTNSRGEVREIQVVQGEQTWTANETEVGSSKRKKGVDKGVKGKRKRNVISERKESSSHLKKFSLDDLNSAGKSKREVFEEYLEKSKVRNEIQNSSEVNTFPSGNEKSSFTAEGSKTDTSVHGINTVTENSTEVLNTEDDSTSNIVVELLHIEASSDSDFDKVIEVRQSDMKDKSLESKITENLQKSVQENESSVSVEDELESAKGLEECTIIPEEINKDSVAKKGKNRKTEPQTLKGKTRILRSRRQLGKAMETPVSITETSLSNQKEVKLKNKSSSLKRKEPMPPLKQYGKFPKNNEVHERSEQTEGDAREEITESRVLEDFCRFFRSEEKCILHLEPITLKLVNPNQLLMIEMDVEKDIKVSSVEEGVTASGLTKYYLKFTVPGKVKEDNVEDFDDPEKEEEQVKETSKEPKKPESKCLRSSRRKQNKQIIKGKNSAPDKGTRKALRPKKENSQESVEQSYLENLNNVKQENVTENECTDSHIEENAECMIEEIEIETYNDVDELETNEEIDIDNKNGNNKSKSKRKKVGKKTGKLSGKKKSEDDKNCSNETKNNSIQKNYTVVVSEEGVRMYMCPLCGYMSKYVQNTTKHINEHTAKRDWICEMCGMSFKSNNSLQKHKIVHTDLRPFPCPLCPQTFKRKKMYQCILCGKEMTIRQNMDIHINQHTGERPWQCEVCGLGFRGPSNLKAHMNQHDEEMKFTCSICSRKFRDRGTYRQHFKRHLGEKKHVCEHCGKSFVITSDLKKHIRTHTGEKPYKCSVCDQHFSDGSSLVRHEKMHAAKFRYECNACHRQYSRRDLCKKHIDKAHTDIGAVEVNEISIIDDLKQVARDMKTNSHDNQVNKMQKATRKSSNRLSVPNTRVKKLKKSWQTLTEEASKRYKEQTIQNIPGTSQYREYTNPVVPTYSIIDYQSVPTFYGNFNQKFSDQQKPQLGGYSGQEIVTPQGPLVFQSYIRNLTDSDI